MGSHGGCAECGGGHGADLESMRGNPQAPKAKNPSVNNPMVSVALCAGCAAKFKIKR
jgi:hypothetical protein